MFNVKGLKTAYDEAPTKNECDASFFEEYGQQVYEIATHNANEAERWLNQCKWFATYSAIVTFLLTIFAVLLLGKQRT